MLKGQTSLELLLIVALVITVAATLAHTYSIEGRTTLADAAVRAEADSILAKAALSFPNCSGARLANITVIEGHRSQDFNISTTIPDCDNVIFTNTTLAGMVSKIHRAQRCISDVGDVCEQVTYNVCAGGQCAF